MYSVTDRLTPMIDVIVRVRQLSTVEYTSVVASVIHSTQCRQWSN